MRYFTFTLVLVVTAACGFLPLVGKLEASETGNVEPADPQAVSDQRFQALLESSPFTRPLNLSGSLVLSGVAKVDGKPVATIIDTKDGRSIVVSESPNERGWKLIELQRTYEIKEAIAVIAVESGEMIRVYYDAERIRETGRLSRLGGKARPGQIGARPGTYTLPDSVTQIEDPTLKGHTIEGIIEGGAFDAAPFEAVDLALAQSHPKTRGPALSAAFGKLGSGVGGVEYDAAVDRLNTLPKGRDRNFAINGLAHGLVGSDPQGALKWANSISEEGFRKVVVKQVTQRIEARSSQSGNK